MSWAVGYNAEQKRDVGYGVPAYCDHPDCNEVINRGFSFVCGIPPYGEEGCGMYFCEKHLAHVCVGTDGPACSQCERCAANHPSFDPKPDHPDWIHHKATDPSWAAWRAEQPLASVPPADVYALELLGTEN